MTVALEGVSGQQHAPAALYSRERPGTNFTGGWVGPEPVWTGGKSRHHRDSIPNRPARSQSLYRLSYKSRIHANHALNLKYNEILFNGNLNMLSTCQLNCQRSTQEIFIAVSTYFSPSVSPSTITYLQVLV